MGKFFDALKITDEAKKGSDAEATVETNTFEDDGALPETPNETVPPIAKAVQEATTKPKIAFVETSVKNENTGINKQFERPYRLQHDFNENLVSYYYPQSFEAEQFRMLRTNILFPSSGKPSPRTILVTSALPGEGKSFVASNLALTVAQNIDKHVLLIDCDMRRPTIHKIFGFNGLLPGLSNYLKGETALPDLLIRTGTNHLSILPGGPIPTNPAELLSSNRMLALLREVRSRYDDRYIIIDSPPPHLTSESKALAQFVDGIIVVVKFGRTNRDLVTEMVDKFQKDKIIGVVANWLDRGTTNLYGKGKYSQYGYYGSKKRN